MWLIFSVCAKNRHAPHYLSLSLLPLLLFFSSSSPPAHLLLNSDRLGLRHTCVHMYIYARARVSHPHCHQLINRGFLLGLTACAGSLTSSHTSFSVLGALPSLTLPTLPTSSQTLASDASILTHGFQWAIHLRDSQNLRE